MYKIKQMPEDFFVEELADIHLSKNLNPNKDEYYSFFSLEKKNWNTRDVVANLARRLNIREARINIAGMKDKNAITSQMISIFKIPRKRVEFIKIKDVKLTFVGYGTERLKLGQITKNKFKIIVRNLDSKKHNKISFIENYFDEQRFSIINSLVGSALVKKDFLTACSLLNLSVSNNDCIGAIRKNIDRKTQIFYINAYQSYLFNKALCEYVKIHSSDYFKVVINDLEFMFSNSEINNIKIPLIGFLSVIRNKEVKSIYERILGQECIKKEDFLLPMMPELSSEGNERNIIVDVDVSISFEEDELNDGKLKAALEFSLEKGAYATIVIKKMFGSFQK